MVAGDGRIRLNVLGSKNRRFNVSTAHIKQALSALESKLRQEIAATPPFIEVLGENHPQLSLSAIIDRLAESHLAEHPLFARINRLDAALCQLELGLYGLCADCETDISRERLTTDPTEQRCHQCAEQYEHEHRHELRLTH